MLYVVLWHCAGVSTSQRSSLLDPKGQAAMANANHRTREAYTVNRLGFKALATQSTFSWIDSTSTMEETTGAQRNLPHASQSEHQFHNPSVSRPVKALGPRRAATSNHPPG
jgi:hypothetical protein